MPSNQPRQPQPFPPASPSEENSRNQDTYANLLRPSTPTTTAVEINELYSPVMNSPTDFTQTNSGDFFISPTNLNIIQMNDDYIGQINNTNNNPDHLSPLSIDQGSLPEAAIDMPMPMHMPNHYHHFTGEALLDDNAFSRYSYASPYTSMPDLYANENATTALLTNMSLEEINAIERSLSSQLADLEKSIREVHSRMMAVGSSTAATTRPSTSTMTTDGQTQERRTIFGAPAA